MTKSELRDLVLRHFGSERAAGLIRVTKVQVEDDPEYGRVFVICGYGRETKLNRTQTEELRAEIEEDLAHYAPFGIKYHVRAVPAWALGRVCAFCPTRLPDDYPHGVCRSCLQDARDGTDDFK